MLSLAELERVARVLDAGWAAARVDKLVQPDAQRVALALRRPGGEGRAPVRRCLVLSCRPESARAAEIGSLPPAPKTPPAFCALLRKHISGGRLEGARIRGRDRQLELVFAARGVRRSLLLSLLGRKSNLYLLDEDGRLLGAQRPLSETRSELRPGAPFVDPSSDLPHEGADRFESVADDALLALIEAHYADREAADSAADLERRLRTALRKETRGAGRRLEKIEAELRESEAANEWQRRGELLKGALARIEPGATEVRVPDHATGERVAIPLDPALSARGNMEAIFKKARRLIRRLAKAGGQVDAARAQVEELAAREAELEGGGTAVLAALAARPEIARLLERHAPAERRRGPSPRKDDVARSGPFKDLPRRLHPRRYRTRDGLEIWVGRHDEGNDYLSTRLARGKDLFFHLDGAPGSHVVLRTEGREDPPSESVLDACELAVHFSKAKRAGSADVHLVPIKQVKKPKGAKPGLVYVTGGRTVHLRREETRLRRLLDARIDEG